MWVFRPVLSKFFTKKSSAKNRKRDVNKRKIVHLVHPKNHILTPILTFLVRFFDFLR